MTRGLLVFAALALGAGPALAQAGQSREPQVGQLGKDVFWIATQSGLIEKMLDLANVTSRDYVIDLGSGDGVMVIAAAKRGARALGIEYDPGLVELSKKNARAAGVADRVAFVKEDLFQSDFSSATVVMLYLTPDLNRRLMPKLLSLKPGTRIVSNSFGIGDWPEDDSALNFELRTLVDPLLDWVRGVFGKPPATERTDHCYFYCRAYFWIVPARIEGRWRAPEGELALSQRFQRFEGTLGGAALNDGRLNGDAFSFSAGGAKYSGRVGASGLEGEVKRGGGVSSPWRAAR